MINIIDINAICDELGTAPPKVVAYANCTAIIIRNGDGEKVLIVADEGMSRESVKHRIAAAFKVKAENLPSDAKIEGVLSVGETKAIPAVLIRESTAEELETHAKASHKHETTHMLPAAPKPDPVGAPLSDEDAAHVVEVLKRGLYEDGSVPAQETPAIFKPDPVTPAKEIRAHQEAKKPHNK